MLKQDPREYEASLGHIILSVLYPQVHRRVFVHLYHFPTLVGMGNMRTVPALHWESFMQHIQAFIPGESPGPTVDWLSPSMQAVIMERRRLRVYGH